MTEAAEDNKKIDHSKMTFFEILEHFPLTIVIPTLIIGSFSNLLSYLIQIGAGGDEVVYSPIAPLAFDNSILESPPFWIFTLDFGFILLVYLLASFGLYLLLDIRYQKTTYTYTLNFITLVVLTQFVGAAIGGLISLLFQTLFFYNVFSVLSFLGSMIVIHYGMKEKTNNRAIFNFLQVLAVFLITLFILWVPIRVIQLLI